MRLIPRIHHLIAILLLYIFSVCNLQALQIYEKSVGEQVVGFMPTFSSIGSEVIQSSLKKENSGVEYNAISVGAKIQVPSHLYVYKSDSPNILFALNDKDRDIASSKGNQVVNQKVELPLIPKKVTQIRWFVIKAKGEYRFADEEDKTGPVIDYWTDETIEIINEISSDSEFVEYTTQNQNSTVFTVPEFAIGYRIGFWALPETENGIPSTGKWIKVFDLGQLFAQPETIHPGPKNPGSDEECIEKLCGTPKEENLAGGGGEVPGDKWIINIFDSETNELVTDQDYVKVDHEYFATIRILDAQRNISSSSAYRDPTPAELATLKWVIFDLASQTPLASYQASIDPNDPKNRVNNNAGTVTIGNETFKKYSFKTQGVNSDAADALKILAPNYSEQGFGIGIEIQVIQSQ